MIVCEGDKTEPIYFNKYKTRYSNLKIVIPRSKYTDPKNLVNFSLEQIKRYDLDLRNGDAIWCVFDCNSNSEDNIFTACKKAGNRVKLCLSNPNFELWFLLHFDFITSKIDRSDVIDRLKVYIPDYDKSINVYDLLKEKRPSAIENSKKLNKMHERNGTKLISIESNPSTQVYAIVDEILKITK